MSCSSTKAPPRKVQATKPPVYFAHEQITVYGSSLLFSRGFRDTFAINLFRISEKYLKGGRDVKSNKDNTAPNDSSVAYIFRPYITLRDGTRLYAKSKGLKAFPIPVHADKQ